MAKKPETTTSRNKIPTTLARKAKKVLQSNGLHYFEQWANKPSSGGRRKRASRDPFKIVNPSLFKELSDKGKRLNRRMDMDPKLRPKRSNSSSNND